MTKRTFLIILAVSLLAAMATSQALRQELTVSVEGYPGEAAVVQSNGHVLVDVQDLARITNGSVTFADQRIVLTLPARDASRTAGERTPNARFSQPFLRAAIEAMASIREWGGMLTVTVQRGYPVQEGAVGNTLLAYQGRAADSVARAAAGASTAADRRGHDLLNNEFNNVKTWADNFARLRSSMTATSLTLSENGLKNDEEAQRLLRCGQFLAQMFADGTFQDDTACH